MKKTLYLLALGVFGIATTEFGVIGILPQIALHFNVSLEKSGWLLSSFALIVAVSGPFLMILLSSFNRKKLMIVSLGFFAISNILSIFAPTFNLLLLARILPAFFHPIFWSIALSTAAAIVSSEQSAKAVGIVFGGFTIASVFGIPLAALITDLFNWKASYILFAIINVLSFAGILFMFPETKSSSVQNFKSHLNVLKNRKLWSHFILSFLMIAAMYSSYGYISAYLEKVTLMSGKEISFMLFLFGSTGVMGNWLAGRFLSKSISITVLFFIVCLASVHLLIYFFGIYFFPMVLMVILWGFVHTGGFLISNINLTTSTSEAPEFVNSIFTTCGNLAVTAGSLFGGFWITHLGINSLTWSSIILLFLPFCFSLRINIKKI